MTVADTLRKRLERRAREQQALVNDITPKSLQKTPSQKNSERLKKKLNRGLKEPLVEDPPSDCRDCHKEKNCQHGNDLEICNERSIVIRCSKCGKKVRVRIAEGGDAKYYCPPCKATAGVR